MKDQEKLPISFRVTPEAKRLLKALSKKLGINQTAVFEVLVRERAKGEGIET